MSENCALCGDISLSELLFLLHSEQLRINLMLSPKASKMNQRKVVNKLIIKSMSDKKGCSSKKLLSAGHIREEPIYGLYRKKKKKKVLQNVSLSLYRQMYPKCLHSQGAFLQQQLCFFIFKLFYSRTLSLTVSLFFEMPKNQMQLFSHLSSNKLI